MILLLIVLKNDLPFQMCVCLRNLAKFIIFLCRDRPSNIHRQTLGTDNKYTKTIETDRQEQFWRNCNRLDIAARQKHSCVYVDL